MRIYDQEYDKREGVVLSLLEAKGLLHLLRRSNFTEPCCTRFAADLAEKLMKEGIR